MANSNIGALPGERFQLRTEATWFGIPESSVQVATVAAYPNLSNIGQQWMFLLMISDDF